MDNDYWDKKSSSVILTQSFRPTPSTFAPKKLMKITQNSSSLRQLRPLTILSPTTSLSRSSPLLPLNRFDNCYNNASSDLNSNENLLQDFQFVNNRLQDNGNNLSKTLQFTNKNDEYVEENCEDQQASRLLMRQMISMYNENNQHIDSSNILDDRDESEDVDNNNCRYVVKITPRSYQYHQQQQHQQQQIYQTPTNQHSYVKIAKISGYVTFFK